MQEDKQIERVKEECHSLFKFKDDPARYEKAVNEMEQIITKLGLNHIIDPLQLSFLLLFEARSFLHSPTEFHRYVDNLLKVKKTSFFFQLPELVGFPDDYRIGHGKLQKFASLPMTLRDFATELTKGKVGKVRTEQERIQTVYLREMSIPADPNSGCWLKISESGISSFIALEKALQRAEESLDILRILRPHIRISLPQYVISKNSDKRKASFGALKIELYRYHFDHEEQKLIDRLNTLVVNPRFDLEKRVLNALHFYRIGRNFSPEDQELFYYVAAIENLIIGEDDKGVLRWKFSEKAAFLLEDDLSRRLAMVSKLKSLYDARSAIAHGHIRQSEISQIPLARDCLFRVIIKILELIDNKKLRSVSSRAKDDSLNEYVDQIKYSGKSLSTKKTFGNCAN